MKTEACYAGMTDRSFQNCTLAPNYMAKADGPIVSKCLQSGQHYTRNKEQCSVLYIQTSQNVGQNASLHYSLKKYQ